MPQLSKSTNEPIFSHARSPLQGPPQVGEQATVVMTDIQASSLLWSRCSAAMGPALDRHDCLLRHMMLLYNGLELATEGDSFQARARAGPLVALFVLRCVV